MKRKLTRLFSILILIQAFAIPARAYCIKIDIKGLDDQYIYLCRHYGANSFVVDSSLAKGGVATFKGSEKLQLGIYFIKNKETKLFDFMLSSGKKMSIQAEYDNLPQSIKVNGDEQSKAFNEIQKQLKEINSANKIDIQASTYKSIRDNNKHNEFIYKMFNMAYAAISSDVTCTDAMDFTDETLLNTPQFAFERLLERYCLEKIDAYSNDIATANRNAEDLISKTAEKSEYRKFILTYMIPRYENASDKKLETVFCDLFQKYYSTKPWWVSDYQYSVLKWKISVTKDNLIGLIGKDITLPDKDDLNHSLYEMKSKYKIVVFWDSECEVCIEAVTNLLAEYASLKEIGAEVFAVYTEAEYDQWKQYIVDNELNWINVSDPENIGTFGNDYGTFKTPRFYILDDHNVIIAKDFNPAKTYETIIEYEKLSNGKKY